MHTAVAVIGLALAGGGAWWLQRAATPPSASGAAAAPGAPGAPAAGARPSGGPGAPAGPASVEVARAEVLTLMDDVQAVGSLKSRQGVMLRPEVSGRIAAVGFRNGQFVQRGQLLVQLDDTLPRAQMQQAQAQASIARTNLARSRELQSQGFVSQSAVDQNIAALQVADAQVALAQAQVERLRVIAPFAGTVGIRRVDVGDYVKDGADIVNLEDLSSLVMEFRLPEQYVGRVRTGQTVEVLLDAMPQQSYKARVDALDSQVAADGRALLVQARLEGDVAQLKPGMFARGRVVFEVRKGAVVVPEEALVPLGARQLLFKVVDGAEGSKVAQRMDAKLGVRAGGKVEILEGVKVGDQVVTAGQTRLLRGDAVPVRIVDLARATAPSKAGGSADPAKAASSGAAASSGPRPAP